MHFFMRNTEQTLLRSLLFFLLICSAAPAWSIDPLMSLRIGEAEAKLKAVEQALNTLRPRIEIKVLREFQEQGLFIKKTANECIDFNESLINKLADDLELLGPQAVTEDQEVISKRRNLNQSMISNAQQLASCRLLLLRAHEVIDVALSKQQQELASELFAKQENLISNIEHNLLNPEGIYKSLLSFIDSSSGITQLWENAPILLFLLVIALAITLLIKKWLKNSLRRHARSDQKGYLSQFQLSLMACANRHMPPLVLTATLSLYYAYQVFFLKQVDFLGILIFGLLLYVVSNLIIRIVLNPCPPGNRLTRLPEQASFLLARRLRLLTKLLLVGFLMYSALQVHDFPQQITALIRNIYLFLLVLNLIWAVWLLRFYEGGSNVLLLRSVIIMGLLALLVADWLGYVNLADFVLLGIIGSMLLWSLTIFILRIWTDFLDGLDEGRNEWQKFFRKRIGVREDEYIPGSFWFRFTFAVVIWSFFLVGLLKVWGLPNTSLIMLKDSVTQGFDLGSVHVVPLKVILALLTFAFLLSIIGWIKRRMNKSWLNRSRLDRSSKESMVSLTGYAGVAVAFLISLSLAGVELANLALIAGALSVGIGFGLQNIVNNFISGVILLFERPIKIGDWIVVGETQGYVKKISIRSTQIQTFDRSDVIVPNSELISQQVTNWMFRDSVGRLIVPIGVAYGTDPEKVKEILLDIAFQHPAVITQSPVLSNPWILFKEFGDSSLNFEIRCFIRNIEERLAILSDFNFRIAKAFDEAGIQIPFPQRDVHLFTHSDKDIKE